MSKRRSIEVPGISHGANPIPAATRIGPFLISGGISGKDIDAGKFSDSVAAQCKAMFVNVRRVLQAAGCSTDDVIKMTIWVRDKEARNSLNPEWVAMFPDAASRPVRHVLLNPDLAGAMLVQCEIMAVITP